MAIWMRNIPIEGPTDGFAADDLRVWVFWSCWRTRQWPFKHVEDTDEILLVESWQSPTRGSRIGWHGQFRSLLREPYESRSELVKLLTSQFGLTPDVVAQEPYTIDAPDAGYVIGFEVEPLRYVGVDRPTSIKMRPNGWRGTDDLPPTTLSHWLAT